MALAAPPFFHIRTSEPENDLPPEQPFATGVFLLQAVETQSLAIIQEEKTRPTNNRPQAQWRDIPEFGWLLALRDIDVETEEHPNLGLYGGWYLHYQGIEASELLLPLIYTCGPDQGGFDPLIGGTFTRILDGLYYHFGQPRYIEVSPWWPGPDFVPGQRSRSL